MSIGPSFHSDPLPSSSRASLAAIFAGGKALRMGGVDKATLEIGGRPLWRHVMERLKLQAERIVVIAPAPPDWLAASGADFIVDAAIGAGPAAALLAALEVGAAMRPEALLLTAPVDAPFLPTDLFARLDIARGDGAAAIVRTKDGLHPVFGLWQARCHMRVREHVAAGELALHSLAAAIGASPCDGWEGLSPDPFMNINTREDLDNARALATQH